MAYSNMKEAILWAALLLAAVLVKVLDVFSNFAISWRVDEHTHRAVALSSVIFWTLISTVGVLVIRSAIRRRLPRINAD